MLRSRGRTDLARAEVQLRVANCATAEELALLEDRERRWASRDEVEIRREMERAILRRRPRRIPW